MSRERYIQSEDLIPNLTFNLGPLWPPSDGRYSYQQYRLSTTFDRHALPPNEPISALLNPNTSRMSDPSLYTSSNGSQYLTWPLPLVRLIRALEKPTKEFWNGQRVPIRDEFTIFESESEYGSMMYQIHRGVIQPMYAVAPESCNFGSLLCENFLTVFRSWPFQEQEDLFYYGLLYTPIFYYSIPLTVILRMGIPIIPAVKALIMMDQVDGDEYPAGLDLDCLEKVLLMLSDSLLGDDELQTLLGRDNINEREIISTFEKNRDAIVRKLREEILRVHLEGQQQYIEAVQGARIESDEYHYSTNFYVATNSDLPIHTPTDPQTALDIATYDYGRVDSYGRVEVGTITNDGENMIEPGPAYTPERLPTYEHPPAYSEFSLKDMVGGGPQLRTREGDKERDSEEDGKGTDNGDDEEDEGVQRRNRSMVDALEALRKRLRNQRRVVGLWLNGN